MLGGGYVNRFVNDGRSYRVIPQVERGQRLNAAQLLDYHVRGPHGRLIPLSTIATLKETVQPRTLNRFQQLNSVKITGVGPSIDGALKKLEAKAAEILPAGYSIDYGGQSRQLRTRATPSGRRRVLALVLIFLVLAAQFNSFRDPVHHPPRLGAAGAGRRHAADLPLENLAEHLLADRPDHAGRPHRQERHPHRRVCQQPAGAGCGQGRRHPPCRRHAAAPGVDDLRRHGVWPSDADLCHRPRRRGPQFSIGWVLVIGMAVGTVFTLYVVPAFYMLIAKDHARVPVAAIPAVSAHNEPALAK
jgi:multidrug efflux pump